MSMNSSRRHFLAAGLAIPAAGKAALVTGQPPLTAPSMGTPAASDEVELSYNVLGKTGLKVTKVGFGCMITSDPSVILRAYDMGINLFDTARVYQSGNNERMVGAALKGKRQNVVLESKARTREKQSVLDEIDTSLSTLGTDYLDVLYLHSLTGPEEITDELLEAQTIAKKQGKIRFAGASFHQNHQKLVAAVLAHKDHFDAIEVSYNFAMEDWAEGLMQQVSDAGIGVVAMKVMAGGFRKAAFYPSDDETRSTLGQPGAMLAALKWVLKNPGVHTAIPSMVNMDELEENVLAMASPFTEQDEKLLAMQLEGIRPLYCRMCGSCEGTCNQGLPVADIIRYMAYAEGYGQYPLAREHFKQLPSELASVRCQDCSSCSVQCPNGVRVMDRVSRAQEIFA